MGRIRTPTRGCAARGMPGSPKVRESPGAVAKSAPEGRWALVHYCANNVSVFADRMTNAEAWAELLFGSQATLNLSTGRLEFRLEDETRAA